jgi:hypothetical protein
MSAKKKKGPGKGGARPGAGRPNKGKRVTVHVKLRPDQHQWLRDQVALVGGAAQDYIVTVLLGNGMPE